MHSKNADNTWTTAQHGTAQHSTGQHMVCTCTYSTTKPRIIDAALNVVLDLLPQDLPICYPLRVSPFKNERSHSPSHPANSDGSIDGEEEDDGIPGRHDAKGTEGLGRETMNSISD